MTQGDGFGGPPGGGNQGGPGPGFGGPAEVGGFGGAAPVPGYGPQGGAPAPQAPQAAAPGGGYGGPPAGQAGPPGAYGGPPGGGYGGPPGGGYGGPPGGPPGGYAAAPPPSASFDQVIANFKLLMSRSGPTGIWGALAAYAAVDVLFALVSLVPQYMAAKRLEEGDILGALAGSTGTQACTWLPLLIGGLLAGAGRLGLVRAQREALFQGAQNRSPVDTIKLGFDRFGASVIVLIVFGIVNGIALCLCILPVIPALWATFMLPFLVAASGMDLGAAFGKSFELAQQHAAAIFGTIGIAALVTIVLTVCQAFTGSSSMGVLVGGVVMTLLRAGAFVVVWQLVGATQITIESVATNTPIART